MNVFVELIIVILKALWLSLVALVKTLVPTKFHPKKDVRNQIVLVTGAGSGLGRLLSLSFARLGARLVLWDIDENGNKKTAELIKAEQGQVTTYTVDLSKSESIYQTAKRVKSEVGDVDILINNAGIVTGKKLLDSPDELIQKTMDVNCNAHFWTTKAFLPSMMSRNHGHIVSIASGAGLFALPELCDYCASKFAVVGFDESLRTELAKQGKTGIHTTLVCPYYINTGMFEGVQTRFPFILPILQPEEVTSKIMDSILINQEMLLIPKVLYFLLFLKGFLPVTVTATLSDFFGVNHSMDDFVGRSKSKRS
jgi:all-trans-retinol dehydrogenase (NAD+)